MDPERKAGTVGSIPTLHQGYRNRAPGFEPPGGTLRRVLYRPADYFRWPFFLPFGFAARGGFPFFNACLRRRSIARSAMIPDD
jgi:hypothetical protein